AVRTCRATLQGMRRRAAGRRARLLGLVRAALARARRLLRRGAAGARPLPARTATSGARALARRPAAGRGSRLAGGRPPRDGPAGLTRQGALRRALPLGRRAPRSRLAATLHVADRLLRRLGRRRLARR